MLNFINQTAVRLLFVRNLTNARFNEKILKSEFVKNKQNTWESQPISDS